MLWTTWVSQAVAQPPGDGPPPPDLPQPPLRFSPAGKSALHWAAAVNNVEAAIVLLKNGANKDMQNNKVGWGTAGRAWHPAPLLSDHGSPNQ